ncbi:MAG: chaperone modulator CbpM [Isosphaeraceae bacterium]
MQPVFLSREQVAQRLAVPSRILVRYEAWGLVESRTEGNTVGYGPSELRRLGTIVSLQRDLGINLAGVEAVLRLRDRLIALHAQLDRLADDWNDAIEPDPPGEDHEG